MSLNTSTHTPWLHTFPRRSARPDKDSSRLAWEESWQDDLDTYFAPRWPLSSYQRAVHTVAPAVLLSADVADNAIMEVDREARELCRLQTALIQNVVWSSGKYGFEKKWRDATDGRREEIILDGLVRACKCGPRIEQGRKMCPDITLRALSVDHGEGYLQMLRKMLPETSPTAHIVMTEPVYVPHPVVDHIFSLTNAESEQVGYIAFARSQRLDRIWVVTIILSEILKAFQGRPAPTSFILRRARTDDRVNEVFKEVLGKKTYMELTRKAREERQRSCWSCNKPESRLAARENLRCCSKCHTIGRQILYCSTECQQEDWNHIPHPHKQVCGRSSLEQSDTMKEGALRTMTVKDELSGRCVPEPDLMFKRSPSLLCQLACIQGPHYPDYAFIPERGHPKLFHFGDPDGSTFLVARTRALRNGDPLAVQVMYKILKRFTEPQGFDESKLREQLEREYEIVLQEDTSDIGDNAIRRLSQLSDEEEKVVGWAMKAKQQGQKDRTSVLVSSSSSS